MTNSPVTQTYYPSLITVFISCSRQDEALLKALDVHLANLKRQGTISAWTDQVIKAGTEWEQEIQQKLAAAQLILLLISPDYIASDLCYCEQMQAALKRHEEGTARVIPIILRPTDMTGSPFSTLTPLPTDAKPITQWRDRDEAFLDVVKGIRRAITSLHPSTPPSPAIQSPIPNPQVPSHSSRFTPSIYNPTTWVERTHITTKLLHILQGNCRILALVGITGIGKTALAERLVAQLTNTSDIPVGAHSRAPIQHALQPDTKPFRRLNLDDGGMTPEFASSGAALLRSLGHEPTVDDQKDPQNLLNHILTMITQRPCRLQIDSMERLLRGNDQEGWSEFCDPLWLELFQRLLTASDCQSQIILTTQEIPENLAYEGSRYDALWHCEPIRGLDEAEQLELFAKRGVGTEPIPPAPPIKEGAEGKGIVGAHSNAPNAAKKIVEAHSNAPNAGGGIVGAHSYAPNAAKKIVGAHRNAPNAEPQANTTDPALGRQPSAPTHDASTSAKQAEIRDYLKRIGRIYDGHPLVLRVIAEDIKTCGGDVARYWQQCRFDDLEANRPTRFSRRKLQRDVERRVKTALESLPTDALQLLCRASVYHRPVPRAFWLGLIPDLNPDQGDALLDLLESRGFATEDWEPGEWLGADGEIPLWQHNLIRNVAYSLLQADKPAWETAHRQAVDLWLTIYEPIDDVPNLEKVRGSIEAFHLYCNLGDWNSAKTILLDQSLGLQLQTWGQYQEMIRLHSQLILHLQETDKVSCARGLGNACYCLSQYSQAIAHYQQSLDLAREIGDLQGQWKALNNLGNVYLGQGDYSKSIATLQQTLAIARELGDRSGEGKALGNLGNAYYSLGQYQQAIDFHQQRLAIARELGDRSGEGKALGNLGNAYYSLGQYQQAIDFHQQYLAIARELGDRASEGKALGNLGIAYNSLGQYQQAIDFHHQYLTIARELGDRAGKGKALGNLGIAYNSLGQYQQAIGYLHQALVITQEICDRQWEGGILGNLGIAYNSLGQYQQAIDFHQQNLAIAREIGNRRGEAYALCNLGETFIKLKRYSEAFENSHISLSILQEIGDRAIEAEVLKNLAELHHASGEREQALTYCEQALAISTELGIPLANDCTELLQQLKRVEDG